MKITKIRFAKSTCQKMALAQSIKAHFQFQIPENLTKNPKIVKKVAEIFQSQKSSCAFFRVIYPSNKITKKSNNVESSQKFDVINTELLGTMDVSKKSENSSEQDGMNEYVETAGEVKDNEVGKHKPENSSGQDEKNKSIEGKEEMEWLDHSEVQSQKHESFGLLLCDYQVDMFSSVLMITSLLQVVHKLDAS